MRIPRQDATLRTMVEDKLRSAIVAGRFVPGQRLVERELCELLSVGRTSVREGLRQLEAEGLVVTTPHKGPSVSRIDYDETKQLYAVRALLEAFAGRQFAEIGAAEDLERLANAVTNFEAAAKAPEDQRRLMIAKTAFYTVLMEGCQNKFIMQMLSLLHNRVNLLRITSMTQPGRLPYSLAEIREINDAIQARDGARAEAACRHHIEMATNSLLSHLRERVD